MGDFIQLVFSGTATGAIYALAALGFTLLWQASGTINFAQGEFVMLPAFAMLFFLKVAGAPLWLREGLAGLHEACEVSSDPPRLVGKPGPRGATLAEALRSGRLIPLEELCSGQSFAAPVRAERYAQARYFCLSLQERGRLAGVYRELRRKPADRGSLPGLLGGASWPELDADFKHFVGDSV